MTWYQQPIADAGPIISARVRLARNVHKYPFRDRLSPAQARRMIAEITDAVKGHADTTGFTAIDPAVYGETDRRVFLEKHIVSREFVENELPTGLLLQNDFNAGIMLNEEDHIRIQALVAGDDIDAAYETANRLDDIIESRVDYAFHKEYGYLTACPTNVGTGMRASFMIHLPLLERTGQLRNMLPAISKFGIALRGLHGEGSEPMGGIYQISNQITLGKSEQEIIRSVQSVALNVIEKETAVRNEILEKRRTDIENNIYRAYGILCFGRKCTLREAMQLLSEVRLGYALDLLDIPKPAKPLYQIMMDIQPGHLVRVSGKELDTASQDVARADYLRNVFKSVQ